MSEFPEYKTSDFMTRIGIVVGMHTQLDQAARYFEKYDFNVLPVVDRSRLVGVLTKTDMLKPFRVVPGVPIPSYGMVVRREVHEFMTTPAIAFHADTPLSDVLAQMIATPHSSFPVVESDQLVGMISREDVLRALRKTATRPKDRPPTDGTANG